MASGGARPGSGRKPKPKHTAAVRKAEKRIADRLPDLVDNMFILAEGVRVEKMTIGVDGPQTAVFQEPPNFKALEYLMNRIMGKPTERQEHEHSGAGGESLPAVVIYTPTPPGADGE